MRKEENMIKKILKWIFYIWAGCAVIGGFGNLFFGSSDSTNQSSSRPVVSRAVTSEELEHFIPWGRQEEMSQPQLETVIKAIKELGIDPMRVTLKGVSGTIESADDEIGCTYYFSVFTNKDRSIETISVTSSKDQYYIPNEVPLYYNGKNLCDNASAMFLKKSYLNRATESAKDVIKRAFMESGKDVNVLAVRYCGNIDSRENQMQYNQVFGRRLKPDKQKDRTLELVHFMQFDCDYQRNIVGGGDYRSIKLWVEIDGNGNARDAFSSVPTYSMYNYVGNRNFSRLVK